MSVKQQVEIDRVCGKDLHSIPPTAQVESHPYWELYKKHWMEARKRNLIPTIYFFEALAYHERAAFLQNQNLKMKTGLSCSDDLQDNVHIYDTVKRWYAGFSNVPQQMMLGDKNPKIKFNKAHGLPTVGYRQKFKDTEWFYLLLIHRVTGSGASFAKPGDSLPPHGWYNTPVPFLCKTAANMNDIRLYLRDYPGPMFTSVGNQIPPFNKPNPPYTQGGREYLVDIAPHVAIRMHKWLLERKQFATIQEAVDKSLEIQRDLGCKQFKFVLTAWVMDLAEYFPGLVDGNSDCYHGKNAIEAIELSFNRSGMKSQLFYDTATRLFADIFDTRPMDVEDAAPGCDLIRWVENYIKPNTYPDVNREEVFNKCYVRHEAGRQPWKVGTEEWIW